MKVRRNALLRKIMFNPYYKETPLILKIDLKANVVELSDDNNNLLSREFASMLIEHLNEYISIKTSLDIRLENQKRNAIRCSELAAEKEEIRILRESRGSIYRDGYVYLAKDEIRGYIKIGHTLNVKTRMTQLKVSNAGVEYLIDFKGTKRDEKVLHGFFVEQRISGEWFKLDTEDIDFIANYFTSKSQSK